MTSNAQFATTPSVLMLGGNFTFVRDWARAASHVANVTLVSGQRRGPRTITTLESLSHSSTVSLVERVVPKIAPRLRPGRLFTAANAAIESHSLSSTLDETQRSVGRDITHIHSHFYPNAVPALTTSRQRNLRLVHTEHSSAILKGSITPRGIRILRALSESAHAILAVSEPLADAMSALGVERPIRVVPNPLDFAAFTSTPAPRMTADHTLELITVGWLLPPKRQVDIIRALAQVLRGHADARLTIVGEGVERPRLEAAATQLGIRHRVRLIGRANRADVSRLLASSDIYVHASEIETFGVALVEAWASGLPVVAYDCGGVSTQTEDIGGILVANRSPSALADAIMEAVKRFSNDDRDIIRERATQRFSPSVVAGALDAAY